MSDVEGIQELFKKLDGLGSLVTSKNLIVRALRVGAEPIREEAQRLAPFETGTLKESMMTTVSEQTGTSAVAKIGPSRKGFYGTFQEFGTAHDAAQPFLRPAYDSKVDEALTIISGSLAAGIETEMVKR